MRKHFSEKEMADLTLAIATINAWNRLAISARATPGTYEPAKVRAKAAGVNTGALGFSDPGDILKSNCFVFCR